MKATIIVKRASITRSDLEQIVVHCDPKFKDGEDEHEYVLVSRVNPDEMVRGIVSFSLGGWETYIFKSDSFGNMVDSGELEGSVRDDIRPVELLKQLGWEVVDGTKP